MKIVSNIKCFVKKSIHKIKRMNKSKKLTALSIFTLLIILGLFMLFNNKTLTEFVSKIINRTETLEYVPLDVTSAQIYTTENELLKSYKQKDMSDEIINDVKISLGFNVKMESLYKDGKWIGQAIYNLPENIKANADNYTGIVYCNGEQVGTFLANANNIILTFDENQMTIGTIIYGNFSFWGSVSFKDLEYSSTYHVKFSEDAYYDVDIELVTSLKLYKKALEPVIDKENSTVTFNYEVRVFSPASTNNEQIEFEDVLTEISSPEENITRPNIKVEWKDYEGNTKEIPNNTKIFKDGKKRIFGTLPPMESGDSIIISYSVIEQSDSFTYKQFNESNKAKVKMQVEGSNPIELEVSTKSAAVTFIGEEWYDINVKKALASSIKNVEENYFKYSYNIEINSTLGTKNHNIDFKDSLSINAQLNKNEITIENFRI